MNQSHDTQSPPSQARLFYLRREFRRVSLWSIAGCIAAIALVGTEWLLGYAPWQSNPDGRPWALLAFVAVPLWLTQYLIPRVRVDKHGIRRRFLWWWRAPWPWEAFRSGGVREEGVRHCYRLDGRPVWRGGRMHFFALELEDAEWIRDQLKNAGTQLPVPLVPRELNIRFPWPDSRKVEMTASGIVVHKKGSESRYQWSDVTGVEIWRVLPGWREFVDLTIAFNDQTLSFHRPNTIDARPQNDQWRGATSAIISAMVCHHVDVARIQDYSLYGEPRDPEERDARHAREAARLERQTREQRFIVYLMWFFAAMSVCALPWMKILTQGIAIVVLFLVVALGIHWIYRSDRKKLVRLRT